MSIKVEFRVGEKDGKEKMRSVYTDLVNLPDPVYLGLTVRIFNYDSVALYMRVDGYAPGWTFTTNNFGSVASGTNITRNIDNFGVRAKPGAALTETITVRLRAYTDAAYSNLKWTYERVITLVFIKSDDGSWIQDVLNNFDDGTVQGWAVVNEYGNQGAYPTIAVVTDYVLSPPYSVRMRGNRSSGLADYVRSRLYKSFTTPDRETVFMIANVRVTVTSPYFTNIIRVARDGVNQIELGYGTTAGDQVPRNKWLRLMVPLPRNTTLEIRVIFQGYQTIGAYYCDLWMDDFRIISK